MSAELVEFVVAVVVLEASLLVRSPHLRQL